MTQLNIEHLNAHWGIENKVKFKFRRNKILGIDIDLPKVKGFISLNGGQILDWTPVGQTESLLWTSDLISPDLSVPRRGGVPVCWPWFGKNTTKSGLPGHGFARISSWNICSIDQDDDGSLSVHLKMDDIEKNLPGYESVSLEIKLKVGLQLEVELITKNFGIEDFVFTEGLHTYFKVGSLEEVEISGLEDSKYIDLMDFNRVKTHHGPIEISEEVGMIFFDNKNKVEIIDYSLSRIISIEKGGATSTVVWNPGRFGSENIADIEKDHWNNFICVESANPQGSPITIRPGGIHIHHAKYSVKPLIKR